MTAGPRPLALDAGSLRVIRTHAAEAYPHECCGALIGRAASAEVVEALPLPNTTDEGPRRRFLVSPADYLAAERHATLRRLDLLGFYHSHPDHPARPSQHDLDHAWPTLHYVIVSVRGGEPGEITAWQLADDRSAFGEESIAGQACSGLSR
jgi:proteasome lid subunit RPN8/RPN11